MIYERNGKDTIRTVQKYILIKELSPSKVYVLKPMNSLSSITEF